MSSAHQQETFFEDYSRRLQKLLQSTDWSSLAALAVDLRNCWQAARQVFLCGNGGSAANALHFANDLLYGVSKTRGSGLRAIGLPANSSILTCLANDCGYDEVYAMQLAVQGRAGDLLIVLSGSGDSLNILQAIREAKRIGMRSYAIVGHSGGKAKELADAAIHFPIDDMQISEDLQLVVCHMIMQWLFRNPPANRKLTGTPGAKTR